MNQRIRVHTIKLIAFHSVLCNATHPQQLNGSYQGEIK